MPKAERSCRRFAAMLRFQPSPSLPKPCWDVLLVAHSHLRLVARGPIGRWAGVIGYVWLRARQVLRRHGALPGFIPGKADKTHQRMHGSGCFSLHDGPTIGFGGPDNVD